MTKGQDTHASLLGAALDFASEEGLGGITIGKLAEKVGMSKSGLFAHFSSKENLQVEVLKTAIDRFVVAVVAPALKAARGEPRLLALFERWLAWKDVLPGGCIFAVASVELDDKPGPARDVLLASQRDWVETLATAARIAIQEGHFKKGVDPDQIAHEIYCLGFGYFHASRLLRDPNGDARMRTAFSRILRDARRSH